VPAFSAAETVTERIEALSTDPPRPSRRRRAAAYAPALVISVVVIGAFVVWREDILHVLSLIRHHCD
jgi:hypothetical protein